MKKFMILTGLVMSMGISGMALAQSKNISYSGNAITEELHLAKGDVVTINTHVPVDTMVIIDVRPKCTCADAGFLFQSSMENVAPNRKGGFVDTMFTGAKPGTVSYTFTGEYEMDAIFSISPDTKNQ